MKDQIVVLDGPLMKGSHVIVPTSMQEEILKTFHEGHQGEPGILKRALQTVYWPNIQNYVTQMTKKCEQCQIHGPKLLRPPTRQVQGTKPNKMLGAEVMDYKGKPYLVQVDYFSGYLFTTSLNISCI